MQAEVASAEELAAALAQQEQALTACRERTASLRLAHEEQQRRLVSGQTLAAAFGVPKSAVSFKGGETSKTKRLLVRGVTAAGVKAVVEG